VQFIAEDRSAATSASFLEGEDVNLGLSSTEAMGHAASQVAAYPRRSESLV